MPLPYKRRRWLRIAAIIAVIATVIAAGVLIARQVYFLGTDEAGRVALYRGLPYELPLGIDLYSEQTSIGVQAATLSAERQEVVTEHKLRSEDDAHDILDDIESREGSQPLTPATPAPPAGQQQKQKQGQQQQQQPTAPQQGAQ
jgi:PPM family protein phosphatase